MGALSGSGLCGRAEAYYYDFLNDPEGADVPPSVVDHIRTCDYCHERIRRLGQMLSEPELGVSRQQRLDDSRLIVELQHHLEYVDRRVVCRDVKPFLPGLLVPSPRITVPTPISSHIDRCARCSRDLRALGGFGLRPEQLGRLRDLYGASPEPDSQMCRQSHPWIELFGSGTLEGIDTEVLEHLCLCPTCRARIYRYREVMLNGDGHDCPGSLSCSGPSMAQVFDYVVPYGMGTARGDAADRLPQRHIVSCSECREMIQLLHRTVYGIAERADSSVGTVYSVKGETQETYDDCAEDASRDELICPGGASPVVVVSEKRSNRTSRVLSHRSLRPYMKAAFLAAAMIPLTIVLHFSAPLAVGLTVHQVEGDILAKARNIHVLEYSVDPNSPSRQMWYARDRKILIDEAANSQTIYDLAAGCQKQILGSGADRSLQVTDLSDEIMARLPEFVKHHLAVSGNDCRVHATMREWGSDASNSIVYELNWESKPSYGGRSVSRRLRIHVDRETMLPNMAEHFRKMPPRLRSLSELPVTDDGYTRERVQRFDYPSATKIAERAEVLLRSLE